MTDLYVVIEMDTYDETGGGASWFTDAYGPFTKEKAEAVAKKFSDMEMVGASFDVRALNDSTNHYFAKHGKQATKAQQKRYRKQGI